MKIDFKDFSKLNPHVASRILNIIAERINYGWDFRSLYPEFFHENNKSKSFIFTKPTKELLFEFFTRMINLKPLTPDEFIVISNGLVDGNGTALSNLIECYNNYDLELQLRWYTAIINYMVDICLTDCTFMADSYNKTVVEYAKKELNIINFLYLAKYT